MKKLLLSALALAGWCMIAQAGGGLGGNVVVTVHSQIESCVGTTVTCSPVMKLNAVADTALLGLSKKPVTDLGTLTNENLSLELPKKVGDSRVYSFKPSQGELANQTVYLAFVNEENARYRGQIYITMVRKVHGQKEAEWLKVGQIVLNPSDIAKVGSAPVTQTFKAQPDGTLTTTDDAGNVVDYPLGKLELLK